LIYANLFPLYFQSGSLYYRYTNHLGVERRFPKPLSLWLGLPTNQRINAAFRSTDMKTYFFVGTSFYQFDDVTFKVTISEPVKAMLVEWRDLRKLHYISPGASTGIYTVTQNACSKVQGGEIKLDVRRISAFFIICQIVFIVCLVQITIFDI